MKYTKEHIISEYERVVLTNGGKSIGRLRFEKLTGIAPPDWNKHWLRWSDLVKDAGYAPQEKVQAYEDDWLLEQLVLFIRELGHYPATVEYRWKSRQGVGFPDQKTFSKFGSKVEIIGRVIDYCDRHPDYADVADICRKVPNTNQAKDDAQAEAPSNAGFVYLVKSGKRYKIGKTESLEKRFAGLSAQVAYELLQVHAIATDDPSGIEAYWHNRFKAARKHGEWFELSAEDIAAFKRRKFM